MFIGDKYKFIHTGQDLNLNRIRLAWHITDWCNYNCPYCIQTVDHHYAKEPKESQEYVEKIANILRPKFHNQNMTLTLYGGEISTYYDLVKICNILFKNNNTTGVVTLLTNLSAPLESYKGFLNLNIKGIAVRIIPSYQWSNLDVFIEKCNYLNMKLENKFQVTCVVYDKHTLEKVKHVAETFKKNGIPIRFTHARMPNSSNKFYELQEGVSDFIKEWNQEKFSKTTCVVTYTDDSQKDCHARSDVLREVAEYEGLEGASFEGMTCFSGLTLTPLGNLKAGNCPDRTNNILANVLETNDFELKPFKEKCKAKGYCNLCNSVLIWNGRW